MELQPRDRYGRINSVAKLWSNIRSVLYRHAIERWNLSSLSWCQYKHTEKCYLSGKQYFFFTRLSKDLVTTAEWNNSPAWSFSFNTFFLVRRELEGTGNGIFEGFGFWIPGSYLAQTQWMKTVAISELCWFVFLAWCCNIWTLPIPSCSFFISECRLFFFCWRGETKHKLK